MKFFKFFLMAAVATALIFSCSKTDINSGTSTGTLKSNDTTGDCLPVTVNGTYTAGIALDKVNNYIDVWVNVTSVGTFNISTDSVNGMSFASSGLERFGTTGLNRVRLYSQGKPILPGLTTFNIIYDGSHCTVSIIVGSLPSGAYILADTSATLPAPLVSGIYTAGVPLGLSDSVVMEVNITKPGSVYLTSTTNDGIIFSGTGVFTTTGIHTITLAGTGVPQKAGSFNFAVIDSLSDSSKFSVTVVPFGGGASSATFALEGAPNGCASFLSYGTYTAGVEIQASDSITTFVDVSKAGAYSIVTPTLNGVVFTSTGTFDTTGILKVVLKGSGLPAAPGTFYYAATGDSSSCTFGISYAQGVSVYTLGGAPGACSPDSLAGVYKSATTLTAANTVTVEVNVVTVGAYSISTPQVDGMTFAANGNFVTTGSQKVTLTGTGTPTSPGIYNFSILSRSGNCGFSVNVVPNVAEFSLGIYPYGQCMGFKLNGNYVAGTTVTSANTAVATVNVSYPGPYTLTTDTADGIIFSAAGNFTTTGTQTVTLYASGKPISVGGYNYTIRGAFNINDGGSTCGFSVNVVSTAPVGPATFTLGGSPNSCSGFTSNGTYTAGVALTSANTVVTQVSVTATGTYSIASNTVNGITFKGTGTFTATGTQSVTLTGSGTPTAAGSSNFTATAGTSTCTFSVTTAQGAAPAAFTLGGSPGSCTGFSLSGTYTSGTALTSSNTAVAQVNVTTVGAYSITTALVNGVTFSASGIFTTTGTQSITLIGTGTPTAAGSFNYTATAGSSSCTFSVTVVQGAPSGMISCTINGTATSFNTGATASNGAPLGLNISGGSASSTQVAFGITFTNGGSAATGTYVNTLNAFISGGYYIGFDYTDASSNIWAPASVAGSVIGGLPPDTFTITITSITATQVVGTFSGTIRNSAGTGTSTMTVTNGTFNVPIQ